MIKNLNVSNFSRYGTVIPENERHFCFPVGWYSEKRKFTGKENTLLRSDGDTYLDYDQGMALMHVSITGEPGNIETFYLDKPVCITRDVFFQVEPFNSNCTVKICMAPDKKLDTIPFIFPDSNYSILSSLKIISINTFFYQEKEKGFYFRGESHPQYELTYMVSGEMHSIVGGRNYDMQKGDAMIYGENQWHMQYADKDQSVRFITVSFNMDWEYSAYLLNKTIPVPPELRNVLRQMLWEFNSSDAFRDDMIICFLKQFLIMMMRNILDSQKDLPRRRISTVNNENTIVDRSLRYICDHVYDKVTVNDVAANANVSPSYLRRLFTKYLKMTPSEYIHWEKLEESKQLIRSGELNISQIADHLSFSSVHHFSNMFRKEYGISPSSYSKQISLHLT